MPTYSYECQNCRHTFDKFQKITADPETLCPECNTDSLKRLIGAGAGLIFKGSGFYITDYRSKDYKDKASKENKTTTTKTETKTESTTSKKTENSKASKSTAK